ncbi:MAG: glycosyltransferase family 2 protein, partial [Methanobacterium paludis]|nr:glycosyltransferase family 2 protein [Methanobacterium paludis]
DNSSNDDSVDKIINYCNGHIKIKSKFFRYKNDNKPFKVVKFNKKDIENPKNYLNIKNMVKNVYKNNNITIIKNKSNYGFAEGNNIGIRFVLDYMNPDYILLLNNDTVVDENFLCELVEIGESNQFNGIIGPKTYYYHNPTVLQSTSIRLNVLKNKFIITGDGEVDKGQCNSIMKTDYVPGSCILIKKIVLETVGLLNSDYFCYWEETELCFRAKKSGFNCIYSPKSCIWHKVSAAADSQTKIYLMTRNKFWFMEKQDKVLLISSLFYFFLFEIWYKIAVCLFYHKDLKLLKSFLAGFIDGIR